MVDVKNISGGGNKTGVGIAGGGVDLFFREVPHDLTTNTRISIASGGPSMDGPGAHLLKTAWVDISKESREHAQRLVNYAATKPSKRPRVSLKVEITGGLCAIWCDVGLRITLYEYKTNDPLGGARDGIIILDRLDVKMKGLGGMAGDKTFQGKVLQYEIMPPKMAVI